MSSNNNNNSTSAQIADFYRRDQMFQMEDRLNQLSAGRNTNNNNNAVNATPKPTGNPNNNHNTNNTPASMLSATRNDISALTNTSMGSFGSGASPLPNQPPTGDGTANLYLGRRSPTLDAQQPPSYVSVPLPNGGAAGNRPLSRKEAAAARLRQNQNQNQQSTPTPAPAGVSSYAEYEQEVGKMGGQVLPTNSQPREKSSSVSHLERAIQERTQAEKERIAKQEQERKEQEEKAAFALAAAAEKEKEKQQQQQEQLQKQDSSANNNNNLLGVPPPMHRQTTDTYNSQQQQQQQQQNQQQASSNSLNGGRTNVNHPQAAHNNMIIPNYVQESQLPTSTANTHNSVAHQMVASSPSPMVQQSNVCVSGDIDLKSQGFALPSGDYSQNNSNHQNGDDGDEEQASLGEFGKEPSLAIDTDNPAGFAARPEVHHSVPHPTNEILEILHAQATPNPVLTPEVINAGDIHKEVLKRQNNATPRDLASQSKTVQAPFPIQSDFDIMAGKSSTSNHNTPLAAKSRSLPSSNIPKLPLDSLKNINAEDENGKALDSEPEPQSRHQQHLSQQNQEQKDNLTRYMEQALGYGSQPPTPKSTMSHGSRNSAPPINITSQDYSPSGNNNKRNSTSSQNNNNNNNFGSPIPAIPGLPTFNNYNNNSNNNQTTLSPEQLKHLNELNNNRRSESLPRNNTNSMFDGAESNSAVGATGYPTPGVMRSETQSNVNAANNTSGQNQNYYHPSGAFAFGKVPQPSDTQSNASTTEMLRRQEQNKHQQLSQQLQNLRNTVNNNQNQNDDALVKQSSSIQTNQQIPPENPYDSAQNIPSPLGGANSNNNSRNNSTANDRRSSVGSHQSRTSQQRNQTNPLTGQDQDQLMNTMQLVALNSQGNDSGKNYRDHAIKMFEAQQEEETAEIIDAERSQSIPTRTAPLGGNNNNDQTQPPVQQSSTSLSRNDNDGDLSTMYRQYGEQSSPARLIRRLHESERQRLALVREVDALKTDLKEAIEQQARMSNLPGNMAANALLQAQQKQLDREQNKLNASRFDPANTNENVIVRVRSTDAAEGEGAQWAAEIDEEEQARTRAQQVMTEMLRAIDARKAAESRLQAVNAENERLRNQAREAQKREAQLHQMLTQYQEAFNSWRSTWNDQNQLQSSGVAAGLHQSGSGVDITNGNSNDMVLGKSQGLSSVRVQILESRVEALTKENEKLRSETNVQAAKRKAQEEAEAAKNALRGRGGMASDLSITSTSGAAALRRFGTDQETDILVRMFELQRKNESLQHNINDMKLQQRNGGGGNGGQRYY